MPANTTIWNAPTPDPDYTRHQAERTAIFNKIAPATNWKMPINCWIEALDFDDCAEASIFFTGSVLRIEEHKGSRVRVQAAGYYEAVGA